jgi:hypothetical protein
LVLDVRLIDTLIGDAGSHRYSMTAAALGEDVTPGRAHWRSRVIGSRVGQKACMAACQARRDRNHHVRLERKKGLWLKLKCHNPTLFNQASETRVQYEARSK